MKRKSPTSSERAVRPVSRPRKPGPVLVLPEEELEFWRRWLAEEYRRSRGPWPGPEEVNAALHRALQAVFRVLQLCPCQIEKRTGISHQYQRKLRRAALAEVKDVHLSLCTLLLITNGLQISLPRFLHVLLRRLPAPPPAP